MYEEIDRYSSSGEPPTPGEAFLISINPALVHREYHLGATPVIIGRQASKCDIVVSGNTVSRVHCRISPLSHGAFALTDLSSTNGVFVNQQRLKGEKVLTEGDRIGLGSVQSEHLLFQRQSLRNRPWVLELPAKQSWTIGRSPDTDIPLVYESTVSALHATIYPREERLQIVDGRSLNGTWINGQRVYKAFLETTDAVMIGSTVFHFQLQAQGRLRVVRQDCGEGIALECIALTYEIATGGFGGAGSKRLLDIISLAIRPGEFIGVLGPSGAGKSTLLKALNGYSPPTYGCTLLNGMSLYRCFDMFRHTIGYVPQDDIVHRELTVRNCLDYVARLRLPMDIDSDQRRDLIDTTIESLGLSHVSDSRVMDLSGGQRKRVSIGCELITRPSLLFLDEPTSGMDPSTEERLMYHFQRMARRGTTVLITTHILYNLALLDRVVILARGKLVFFGTPREAMEFFTTPEGDPIERPTQIFDILEGVMSSQTSPVERDSKEMVAIDYQRKYLHSGLFQQHVRETLSELAGNLLKVSGTDPQDASSSVEHPSEYQHLLEKPTRFRRRFGFDLFSWRSLVILTQRHFAIKLVSLKQASFYLLVPVVLALITLTLRTQDFPDAADMAEKRLAIEAQVHQGGGEVSRLLKRLLAPAGTADPRPAEEIVFALKYEGLPNLPVPMSVLLMFVMTAIFIGTLMACLELSSERPIYLRERMANQKIADYLVSKLPFLLLLTALQCALFLGLCGLSPGLQQFNWPAAYVALVAMAWVAVAMGLVLSAVDPTSGRFSVILAIVVVLPQLILSGGMAPDFYEGMVPLLRHFADFFPARWGLEMLLTAFYYHPDQATLDWIEEFVPEVMGFRFGSGVYWTNILILTVQALVWLALCTWILKRYDRLR